MKHSGITALLLLGLFAAGFGYEKPTSRPSSVGGSSSAWCMQEDLDKDWNKTRYELSLKKTPNEDGTCTVTGNRKICRENGTCVTVPARIIGVGDCNEPLDCQKVLAGYIN